MYSEKTLHGALRGSFSNSSTKCGFWSFWLFEEETLFGGVFFLAFQDFWRKKNCQIKLPEHDLYFFWMVQLCNASGYPIASFGTSRLLVHLLSCLDWRKNVHVSLLNYIIVTLGGDFKSGSPLLTWELWDALAIFSLFPLSFPPNGPVRLIGREGPRLGWQRERDRGATAHRDQCRLWDAHYVDGWPLYWGLLYTKEGGSKEGRSGEGLW